MIEIISVVMMLILFVGAYLWREEARDCEKLYLEAIDGMMELERKNKNQAETIKCLMSTCDRHNIPETERWKTDV